jgi:hypothetical protein
VNPWFIEDQRRTSDGGERAEAAREFLTQDTRRWSAALLATADEAVDACEQPRTERQPYGEAHST